MSTNFEETKQTSNDISLSPKEIRKISEDMKNDLNTVIKYMEDAIKFSIEEKIKASALRSMVIEKEDEVRKVSEEIVSTDRKMTKNEREIAEMEKELNNLVHAIEGIKEITSELNPMDSDKAVSSLKGAMIKKQADVERAHGELSSLRKLKDLATKRLSETEKSLAEAKRHYSEKMTNADLLVENAEESISHIVKTYNDVISVAKELLMENLGSKYANNSEPDLEKSQTRANTSYGTRDKEPLST